MSDPIAYPSVTPVIGLPLLVAGQAQKEFFVNQALCLLDALHQRAVTASQPAPPPTSSAQEGECYRVTAPAAGVWSDHEDEIAILIGGDWHFVAPQEGMQVFDRSGGQLVVYRSRWEHAGLPAGPTGGTVIDAEARAVIASLIHALQAIGVLGPNSP